MAFEERRERKLNRAQNDIKFNGKCAFFLYFVYRISENGMEKKMKIEKERERDRWESITERATTTTSDGGRNVNRPLSGSECSISLCHTSLTKAWNCFHVVSQIYLIWPALSSFSKHILCPIRLSTVFFFKQFATKPTTQNVRDKKKNLQTTQTLTRTHIRR